MLICEKFLWYQMLINGHGTLALNADGSFSYMPYADFNGPDSFSYFTSDDDGGVSNEAIVSISVAAVNDPPVAQDGSADTPEDTNLDGTLTANDIDSATLTYSLVGGASHGGVTLQTDGSFHYVPNENYNGADSFTFKANDGEYDSNVASFSITVTPVNDAPLANGGAVSTNEDTPLAGMVTAHDVEGDALTFSLVGDAGHGTLALQDDGSYLYTPAPDYWGGDSFSFRASDGQADSNTATISITVNAVNDPPSIAPIADQSVSEGTTLQFYVPASDPDLPPSILMTPAPAVLISTSW